jgi:anaphase-promoting complex subunit 1
MMVDMYSWIQETMAIYHFNEHDVNGQQHQVPPPRPPPLLSALPRTKHIVDVYAALYPVRTPQAPSPSFVDRSHAVVAILAAIGSDWCWQDIPLGVALPLQYAIYVGMYFPHRAYTSKECLVVKRPDLYFSRIMMEDNTHQHPSNWNRSNLPFIHQPWHHLSLASIENNVATSVPCAATGNRSIQENNHTNHENKNDDIHDDEDLDGLALVVAVNQMLFPRDQRLKEVARLLRSSKPMVLTVVRESHHNDADVLALQQQRLLLLCKREFSMHKTTRRPIYIYLYMGT